MTKMLAAPLFIIAVTAGLVSAASPIPPQYQRLAGEARKAGVPSFVWPSEELAINVYGGILYEISGLRATSLTTVPVPFRRAHRLHVRDEPAGDAKEQVSVDRADPGTAPVGSATRFVIAIPTQAGFTGQGIVDVFLLDRSDNGDAKAVSNVLRLWVDIDKKQVKVAK
jgi:hypothetical protein